jgi:hypothetical protein
MCGRIAESTSKEGGMRELPQKETPRELTDEEIKTVSGGTVHIKKPPPPPHIKK